MQQAINDGVIFEASADTPDFSPELAAAFGFTQAQAEAVLKPALAARDLPVSCSAFWRSWPTGASAAAIPGGLLKRSLNTPAMRAAPAYCDVDVAHQG